MYLNCVKCTNIFQLINSVKSHSFRLFILFINISSSVTVNEILFIETCMYTLYLPFCFSFRNILCISHPNNTMDLQVECSESSSDAAVCLCALHIWPHHIDRHESCALLSLGGKRFFKKAKNTTR